MIRKLKDVSIPDDNSVIGVQHNSHTNTKCNKMQPELGTTI